jgi:C_GCAxxG_C_C family probable redox protein
MDRESMLREAERIHDGYVAGLNCAERVFLAVHAFIDTDVPARAVAMLSGLGGGVGGTRDDICGAVTGGVAALGLIHGRPSPPEGDRERAYVVARDFVSRFRTAFGVTGCCDLVGDLLREGTADAEELRKARCARFTRQAVRLCLETLVQHDQEVPPR